MGTCKDVWVRTTPLTPSAHNWKTAEHGSMPGGKSQADPGLLLYSPKLPHVKVRVDILSDELG